jgi:hypothetical protein
MTNNARLFAVVKDESVTDEMVFSGLLDAVLYALDSSAIGFARVAKRGSAARNYAAILNNEEVISAYRGRSERFLAIEESEPEAAALLGMAIEFGLRLISGEAPQVVNRWADTDALFIDALDFEANMDRTHQQWIQWFLDVAKVNHRFEEIKNALTGILEEMYSAGVVHGRFYAQQSLAWSAWSGVGYSLVGLAEFPNGFQSVIDGATVLAALILIHAGDAANGIATREAGEFLDVMNEDTGKLASSFVSLTTGPGSQKQKAPFPEDFAALFNQEVVNFGKSKEKYAARQAVIAGYGMDELESAITGVAQSTFTNAAEKAAMAQFGK